MKYLLVPIVLISGLAILATIMFPDIGEGSWLRQWSFAFWTVFVPVAIASYIFWRIVKRR